MTIRLIFCQSLNGAIGKDNDLLFKIPEDMKRFKELTKGAAVVMGHKTWVSIPPRFRPLADRLNIVLTRDLDTKYHGVQVMDSLKKTLKTFGGGTDIWIIGGEALFREGLQYADEVYQTLVYKFVDGDVRAPDILSDDWDLKWMSEIREHEGLRYQFRNFSRKHHGDQKAPIHCELEVQSSTEGVCGQALPCSNICQEGASFAGSEKALRFQGQQARH